MRDCIQFLISRLIGSKHFIFKDPPQFKNMIFSIEVSVSLVILGYFLLLITEIVFFNIWNLIFVTLGILLGIFGLLRKRSKFINYAKIWLSVMSVVIIVIFLTVFHTDNIPSVIPMPKEAKIASLFILHILSISFILYGSENYYRYYD